ncbi:MAG: hypothetical protein CM15mP74_15720 [Halieaceae bacterium]|nr:MAG: hypothetical protein CM15mP74_15720 [Halieaceae bacterium]
MTLFEKISAAGPHAVAIRGAILRLAKRQGLGYPSFPCNRAPEATEQHTMTATQRDGVKQMQTVTRYGNGSATRPGCRCG